MFFLYVSFIQLDFNPLMFSKIPVVKKEEVADILEYFDMETEDVDVLFDDLELVRYGFLNFSTDGKTVSQ